MERAELWYRAGGGYREQGSGNRVCGMVVEVLRGQRYDNNSDIAHCEFDIVRGCCCLPYLVNQYIIKHCICPVIGAPSRIFCKSFS